MHLIIGLGNPGREYELTRHNLGFLVADELAGSARSAFQPGKGEYWLAKCSLNESTFIVLKPVTYMNSSGIAVEDFLQREKISLGDTLVVCDDFQLPLGTVRLRPSGSDGGHNGLASIIYHLQTDQFPRLRCGIASTTMPADKSMMADFVLERFAKPELPAVKRMVDRAKEASIAFVEDGIDGAMNRFNSPPSEETTT